MSPTYKTYGSYGEPLTTTDGPRVYTTVNSFSPRLGNCRPSAMRWGT